MKLSIDLILISLIGNRIFVWATDDPDLDDQNELHRVVLTRLDSILSGN